MKSTFTSVDPGNRALASFAEPKSTSRSTQSVKVTSVSRESRKFTESSLQPCSDSRRPASENACTPAKMQPLNHASVIDDSARSTATSRDLSNHASVQRERRSRVPSKLVPSVNAHSVNRAPAASPPSSALNERPANSFRS